MMDPQDLCAGGTLRAAVWTAAGGVIDYHEQPVDSYVIQWAELHSAVLGNQDVSGVTDTSGTDHTLERGGAANPAMDMGAGSNLTNFGLLIGADGTDETVTDNDLASQLTTDINHGSTDVGTGSVSGSAAFLDITRTFTNNTGQTVSINEAGLVATHDGGGGATRDFLCLRDTGSPIADVANGNNVTLEYELEYQV